MAADLEDKALRCEGIDCDDEQRSTAHHRRPFYVEFRRASQWPRLNSFGVIAVTVSGRLSLLGSTSSSVHNDAAAPFM
jgi:hypothetical protein